MTKYDDYFDLWNKAIWAVPLDHLNLKRSPERYRDIAAILGINPEAVYYYRWGFQRTTDPELIRKLHLLASPFGPALAKIKLKKLKELEEGSQ